MTETTEGAVVVTVLLLLLVQPVTETRNSLWVLKCRRNDSTQKKKLTMRSDGVSHHDY